jgi:hypothetical protein
MHTISTFPTGFAPRVTVIVIGVTPGDRCARSGTVCRVARPSEGIAPLALRGIVGLCAGFTAGRILIRANCEAPEALHALFFAFPCCELTLAGYAVRTLACALGAPK